MELYYIIKKVQESDLELSVKIALVQLLIKNQYIELILESCLRRKEI